MIPLIIVILLLISLAIWEYRKIEKIKPSTIDKALSKLRKDFVDDETNDPEVVERVKRIIYKSKG